MNEERPVVYTISEINHIDVRIYTKDSRIKDGDNDITVCNGNLLPMMINISTILNDEGYAVLFEVD